MSASTVVSYKFDVQRLEVLTAEATLTLTLATKYVTVNEHEMRSSHIQRGRHSRECVLCLPVSHLFQIIDT